MNPQLDIRDKQIEGLRQHVQRLQTVIQKQSEDARRHRSHISALQEQVRRLSIQMQEVSRSMDSLRNNIHQITDWMRK